MKIFMLADHMDMGGAETHIFELSRRLVKEGHEVTVLSGGGRLVESLVRAGIRHLSLPDTGSPAALTALAAHIRQNKPRLVHAHTRRCAFLCRLLLKQMAFPLVVTAHAMFSHSFPTNRLSFFPPSTIAVSEDIRQTLIRHFSVPSRHITIIPNGIDTCRFSPSPSQEENIIVSVSRLDRDCSATAHLLCELLPTLCQKTKKPWRLWLVGDGNALPSLAEAATRINQRLGWQAIVLFGARRDIPRLLAGGSIFVGVSRAALEAMAMEKPLIFSGNEGYLGIADEGTIAAGRASNFCGRNGIAPTKELLLRDLLRLDAMSPHDRRRLGTLGRQEVLAGYTAEIMTKRTLEVYRQELSRFASTKKTDVVICGYYGFGNCGDEMVLASMIDQQKRLSPGMRMTVLTARGKAVKGCTAVSRNRPLLLLRTIKNGNAFILGGGSLLQDATSRRSLLYYLTLLSFAHRAAVPTMLYANGLGPLSPEAFEKCRRLLSFVDVISLRDTDSYRAVCRMNLPHTKVILSADPVMTEPLPAPPSPRTPAFLAVLPKGGESYEREKATAKAVAQIALENKLDIILAPMSEKQDRGAVRRMEQLLGRLLAGHGVRIHIASASPRAIERLIGRATLVISQRLHGLILSFRAGVRCVGLGSDPKILSFLREAQLAPCYAVSPDAMVAASHRALALVPSQKRAQDLRCRALLDAHIANQLILRGQDEKPRP